MLNKAWDVQFCQLWCKKAAHVGCLEEYHWLWFQLVQVKLLLWKLVFRVLTSKMTSGAAPKNNTLLDAAFRLSRLRKSVGFEGYGGSKCCRAFLIIRCVKIRMYGTWELHKWPRIVSLLKGVEPRYGTVVWLSWPPPLVESTFCFCSCPCDGYFKIQLWYVSGCWRVFIMWTNWTVPSKNNQIPWVAYADFCKSLV